MNYSAQDGFGWLWFFYPFSLSRAEMCKSVFMLSSVFLYLELDFKIIIFLRLTWTLRHQTKHENMNILFISIQTFQLESEKVTAFCYFITCYYSRMFKSINIQKIIAAAGTITSVLICMDVQYIIYAAVGL